MIMNQCKCGSIDFFTEQKGSSTGLYCSICGKWQKWLNKNELRAFEHSNQPKKAKKQTQADRIRSMTDEELAEFLTGCDFCLAKKGAVDCSEYQTCEHCNYVLKKWLQSEVKESAE